MKAKTKIGNADFVAAIGAIENIEKILDNAAAHKGWVDFQGWDIAPAIRPFDMVSNGATLGRVGADDVWLFVVKWFKFIDRFNKEDAHGDLFFSWKIMCDEFINVGVSCFSLGAFIGVYGVFQVALMKCLMSLGVRVFGGVSVEERFKRLDVQLVKNSRSLIRQRLIELGNKAAKSDFKDAQYEEVRMLAQEKNDDSEKFNLTGKKGLMCLVWNMRSVNGISIPKNAGMDKKDWQPNSLLSVEWRRRLIRDGVYMPRKNKPGAGGARRMK